MFSEPVYVRYRRKRPEEERVEEVGHKLQEKNIDVSQLAEWPVDHCQQVESSTEKQRST